MDRFEGINSGAIKAVKLVELNKAGFYYAPKMNITDIVLADGAAWEDIPITLESGFFRDHNENSRAGVFWKKEVKFKFPAIRNEVTSFFMNFSGKKLVALVTDMNDRSWLIYPLRILWHAGIPQLVPEYNGYEVEMWGQNTLPAPEVELLE